VVAALVALIPTVALSIYGVRAFGPSFMELFGMPELGPDGGGKVQVDATGLG